MTASPHPDRAVRAARTSTGPDGDAPRYRVLATPRYRAAPASGETTPVSFSLEITRVDLTWRLTAGDRAHDTLGVVAVGATVAGRLPPDEARLAVVAYLVGRASPLPCRATPADVELYVRVPDAPPDDLTTVEP